MFVLLAVGWLLKHVEQVFKVHPLVYTCYLPNIVTGSINSCSSPFVPESSAVVVFSFGCCAGWKVKSLHNWIEVQKLLFSCINVTIPAAASCESGNNDAIKF